MLYLLNNKIKGINMNPVISYDMHSETKQWGVVPIENPSLENVLFGHFFATSQEAKDYASVLKEQDSNWHLTVKHYNELLINNI